MSVPSEKINFLKEKAYRLRKDIIEMLTKAASGHPGGSLSSVEIMTSLFFEVMKHNPTDPSWPERDKFHISKGHGCPSLYAALAEAGYFDRTHLGKLRTLGALLQGHPDPRVPGVEYSSGSLGQGLSVAIGMALAARLDGKTNRIYCLMGDGEIQEGNIWEAAMSAAHYELDNLCGILDCNGLQIDGKCCEVMRLEPIADKWRAFGWHVLECDGHSFEELIPAFNAAREIKGRPTLILARTVKGKGVSFMEHKVGFHGVAPTAEEARRALEELLQGRATLS
jgi:transketolase